MCEWGTETVLPRPWFMEDTDERLNGVPVDKCIAPIVTALWDAKIVTLGSCCGHGNAAPSLVLGSGEDWRDALTVIVSIDARVVELLQWQLVSVDDGAHSLGVLTVTAEEETG